jgi:hypothetical protein
MKTQAGLNGKAEGLNTAFSALVSDATRLVQLEVQLARQEVIEILQRNAVAVGMLVAAGISGLVLLIMAQVWLVVAINPHAWVAGIIVAFWLLAGMVLGLVGKARLKIEPPQRALGSLKEDLAWVKQQIKHEQS